MEKFLRSLLRDLKNITNGISSAEVLFWVQALRSFYLEPKKNQKFQTNYAIT